MQSGPVEFLPIKSPIMAKLALKNLHQQKSFVQWEDQESKYYSPELAWHLLVRGCSNILD